MLGYDPQHIYLYSDIAKLLTYYGLVIQITTLLFLIIVLHILALGYDTKDIYLFYKKFSKTGLIISRIFLLLIIFEPIFNFYAIYRVAEFTVINTIIIFLFEQTDNIYLIFNRDKITRGRKINIVCYSLLIYQLSETFFTLSLQLLIIMQFYDIIRDILYLGKFRNVFTMSVVEYSRLASMLVIAIMWFTKYNMIYVENKSDYLIIPFIIILASVQKIIF